MIVVLDDLEDPAAHGTLLAMTWCRRAGARSAARLGAGSPSSTRRPLQREQLAVPPHQEEIYANRTNRFDDLGPCRRPVRRRGRPTVVAGDAAPRDLRRHRRRGRGGGPWPGRCGLL